MGTSKRMRQKAGRQLRLEAARAAQQRAKRRRTLRNIVLVVLLVVIAAVVFAQVGGDDSSDVATTDATTTFPTFPTSSSTTVPLEPSTAAYGTGPCPAADGSSPRQIDFTEAPMQCIDPSKSYTAVFDTSKGTVSVALDTSMAPVAVNSFVVLARYHYYDNTTIFRSNTGIAILQGGSPHTEDNTDPGPGFAVEDEGGVFDFSNPAGPKGPFVYGAGDLVLARSAGPDSSGGQYFFGVNESVADLSLQGTYIKLGTTTEGLDVLEAILALHADADPATQGEGAPSETITINSVTILEA